jgi:1,2-diacylglycerol 3-alpha-glucosyltransferase
LSAWFVPERRLAYGGVRSASQLIKKLEIDIIHTQTEFSMGCLGKYLANKHKLPFVHTYHTMYEDYVHYVAKGRLLTPAMVGKLTRWFCRGANLIIAPTEKVKRILENYGVSASISITPTGISLQQFQRTDDSVRTAMEIKGQLGLSATDRVVISVGRMAEEKNMQALIKAVKECHSCHFKLKLVLVGDGPERQSLEDLAKALRIAEHVLFLGEIDWRKIQHYYQISEVFLSASTTEAQGLTYIEAMASGCVVIAKADPSIDAIISHEETGFVFEEDRDIATLLMSIWDQTHILARIQKAAQAHIQPFSADAFGAKLELSYMALLQDQLPAHHYAHKSSTIPYRMRRKSS